MSRFEVVRDTKFSKLSQEEMQAVKGGLFCISCKKRTRKFELGFQATTKVEIPGSPTGKQS